MKIAHCMVVILFLGSCLFVVNTKTHQKIDVQVSVDQMTDEQCITMAMNIHLSREEVYLAIANVIMESPFFAYMIDKLSSQVHCYGQERVYQEVLTTIMKTYCRDAYYGYLSAKYLNNTTIFARYYIKFDQTLFKRRQDCNGDEDKILRRCGIMQRRFDRNNKNIFNNVIKNLKLALLREKRKALQAEREALEKAYLAQQREEVRRRIVITMS